MDESVKVCKKLDFIFFFSLYSYNASKMALLSLSALNDKLNLSPNANCFLSIINQGHVQKQKKKS